jgi:tRNA (mo5U34)-methyltransferase
MAELRADFDSAAARVEAELARQQVEATTWFHAIDFGPYSSSGRFRPGEPQNQTLFPFMDLVSHVDLKGMRALDIGSADGLASFGMTGKGASVTAIDSYDLRTFQLARKILGLEIDYHPRVQVKDLVARFGTEQFDFVLCAGVIYHMLNPYSAILQVRKAIREGGLFVLESPVTERTSEPAMFFNSEMSEFKELYTYWVPTPACMIGMLKLASFNIIATRMLKSPRRFSILAQATTPDQVGDRGELLQRIHAADTCDFEFRLSEVAGRTLRSAITYTPMPKEAEINPMTFVPSFPYQPKSGSVGLGKTRWLSENKNY